MKKLPHFQPMVQGNELEYIRQALDDRHLSSGGSFTQRCQEFIRALVGGGHVRLTHSATAALELSVLLADIKPGDQVVMPAFTFVACANAVALRGGIPVLVDIDGDTLNLDPSAAAKAMTRHTRAIMPVHYAGVPCDMAAVSDLALKHGLFVIEDAAQALLSSYEGKPAGTLGDVGVFSFHATKNITAGEGGAIIVNNGRLGERAGILHKFGTDLESFQKGLKDHYSWVDLGSSFGPSELAAAMLLAQLERATEITKRRRAIWDRYHSAFADPERAGAVRRPVVPANVEHNAHIYFLLLPNREKRDRFIAFMAARGISTPFHFIPLNNTPGARRFAQSCGDLTVTESVASRIVRLPLWPGMEDEQERIIGTVCEALQN